MTEETKVIHALQWWRRLRRLAERRLDAAIARRSVAAGIRPARCAGDLADVAEQLLTTWQAVGTAEANADLRTLSVALLAFSDQLAAEDREQRGRTRGPVRQPPRPPTPWPHATPLTYPRRNPAGRLTALPSGLRKLYGWLAVCTRDGPVGGADEATRNAAVALCVIACLAEREPVVIAVRVAAEIAAGRTAYLVALRQASHAISESIFLRRLRRSP